MRIIAIVVAIALCAACDQIRQTTAPPTYDGAYVVIEIDQPAAVAEHLEQLSDQAANVLRDSNIGYVGRGVSNGALRIRLADAADLARARAALAPISGHLAISEQANGIIEARINDAYLQSIVDQAAGQSIGIIERRVSPIGSGARVEPFGPARLIIRTNEATIPDHILRAVSLRGQVTFHMVSDVLPGDRPPIGTVLAQPYLANAQAEVVQRRPAITGHISDANPSTDPVTGQFVVMFEFDEPGARRFCQITRQHTGKRFAVLLDGRVITAPTINEPICGGSGQIEGNFTAESANETAIVLRAGALPMPFGIAAQGVGVPPPPN
jgi:protein-export membrane protein SecD